MTDWREELIKKMSLVMFEYVDKQGRLTFRDVARAALAVAEPVIREQVELELREENARLRELLKPFAYIAEHVGEEDARWAVPSAYLRAVRVAIREGGSD